MSAPFTSAAQAREVHPLPPGFQPWNGGLQPADTIRQDIMAIFDDGAIDRCYADLSLWSWHASEGVRCIIGYKIATAGDPPFKELPGGPMVKGLDLPAAPAPAVAFKGDAAIVSHGVDLANGPGKTAIAVVHMAAQWAPEPGYERLVAVLRAAHDQAAVGKGKERHANALPFHEQPMQQIGRRRGIGFILGQADKKSEEAQGMLDRGELEASKRELLGAINYLAGAYIFIEENFTRKN